MRLVYQTFPTPSNYSDAPDISMSYSQANGVISFSSYTPANTHIIDLPPQILIDTNRNVIPSNNSSNTTTIQTGNTTVQHSMNVYSLQSRKDCKDHVFYLIDNNEQVVNIFAETYMKKSNVGSFMSNYNSSYLVVIPVASDINTYSVILQTVDAQKNVSISGDFVVTTANNTNRSINENLPIITFGTPSENSNIVSIPVNSTHNCEVLYESTVGALYTPRLTGNGTVLIDVTNVAKGTVGKLKANFKYFSGKADVTYTV
jgi:hypothetical protein